MKVKQLFILSAFACAIYSCTQSKGQTETTSQSETEQTDVNAEESTDKNRIGELAQYFDEQKKGNDILVQPKDLKIKPQAQADDFYCYFYKKGDKAISLRFRIQYWSEKFADVDQYNFTIDGKSYSYIANGNKEMNSDPRIAKGSTFYWFDNTINQSDLKFLESIGDSKNATITLFDRGSGTDVATIDLSERQKQNIKYTLEYYKALGGATIPKKGMVNIRG